MKVKNKILHIVSHLGQGGAERQLLELLEGNKNHAVCQLCPNGYYEKEVKAKGNTVFDLGMKRKIPDIRAFSRLNQVINCYQPDIIHTWMYHASLLEVISRKIRKNKNIPLIWGLRCSDMDTSFYSLQLKLVIIACKYFSSIPNLIINNSYVGKKFHEKIGFKNNNIVISNGIDTDKFAFSNKSRIRFRKNFKIPLRSKVLLSVARLDPMKDHKTLLFAFKKVKEIYPDITLILAGLGTENISKRESVLSLGPCKNIEDVYSASDIIISSSAFGEGFSNALGEGMSCNLVPISTNVGDAKYIINSIGKIIKPGDVKNMFNAIIETIQLSDDIFLQKKYEARKRISLNFSKQKMISSYSEIYKNIMTNK